MFLTFYIRLVSYDRDLPRLSEINFARKSYGSVSLKGTCPGRPRFSVILWNITPMQASPAKQTA